MSVNGWTQIALYSALVIALTRPLGGYLTRVMQGERTFLSPVLRPPERVLYAICGVDERAEHGWQGYALAMLPVNAKNLMMLLLIALLVVPPEVSIVPLFVMVSHVPLAGGNDIFGNGGQGLLNTLPGIMVPHIVSALAIFLMRQFYAGLPAELGDAARVDGASEFRIFAEIYTPLVKPAVAVVGVFAFQAAWNDFIWPLVVTYSNDMRTLQLGLTVFFQENSTQWNLLMAAVLGISIPIVVMFLLIQRYFQEGALAGALK